MKTYYSIQHKLGEPEILIRGITADATGENPCLWVELIFEQTERKICYELTPEGWQYLTGEDEPEHIPAALLQLWHGSEGEGKPLVIPARELENRWNDYFHSDEHLSEIEEFEYLDGVDAEREARAA